MKIPRSDDVVTGNANEEGKGHGSWFVGHFVDAGEGNPRITGQVEVQLRRHPKGNLKKAWSQSQTAHTLVILIRGKFIVKFPSKSVILEEEGDYCLWPPGLSHSWSAPEDTLVVTVRWPSVPHDVASANPGSLSEPL